MSHKYKHNGLELPSCTTIINDCTNKGNSLIQWSSNCCANSMLEVMRKIVGVTDISLSELMTEFFIKGEDVFFKETYNNARFAYKEISKQAREVGSEAHSAIKAYLTMGEMKKLPDSFSEDMREELVNAFNAFIRFKKDYELEMVRSEFTVYGEGWAGTADLEGWILVDGKRKLFLLDWKASNSLYRETRIQTCAYRSMTHCEGNAGVRLDKKTGLYEFKDYSKFYEQDLKEWHSTVNLYFDRHPQIRKKAFKKED